MGLRLNLPIGDSSFASIRGSNPAIYVDKAKQIFELAKGKGHLFLSRPRRFGKSLLISTFESLFKKGLTDFRGLEIEKLWTDHTYDVLTLTFSDIADFSSKAEFLENLDDELARQLKKTKVNYVRNKNNPVSAFKDALSSYIDNHTASLVLLIDEYDAPITSHLEDKPLCEAVQSVLSSFYNEIKTYNGAFRFIFVTGITKFRHTSIFSPFNILTDISLSPDYGDLLGYTIEEVERYFAPWLCEAAKALGMTVPSVMANLKEWYDGYCFDSEVSKHVFNPWSVLSFLQDPKRNFFNYWYQSGGRPTVLASPIHSRADILNSVNPLTYGQGVHIPASQLTSAQEYSFMATDLLLFQTGYLTLKAANADKTDYLLDFPNREVSQSMAQLYSEELLSNRMQPAIDGLSGADIFNRDSVEHAVQYFNAALNMIDYKNYPIRDESSCRAYIQVLLIGAALLPSVEVHSAMGRSDLEVDGTLIHWMFEFKYCQSGKESDIESLLEKGQHQLQNRRYGVRPANKKVLKIVLIFSESQRQFVK